MIVSSQTKFKNIASEWSDVHKYSPAPRHRRRILLSLLNNIPYTTCLDVGCAQPYLLETLHQQGKRVFGCDISDKVIATNKKIMPYAEFAEVDIAQETYPAGKQFDVVISTEVLEHIDDWKTAVKNLASMAKQYLVITVPSGKVYPIDAMIGHYRHYHYGTLQTEIEKQGFKIVMYRYWGFPFHSLYKRLINMSDYQKTYAAFAAKPYGIKEKVISQILYVLFFCNDIFARGAQLFIVAKKES